MRIEQKRKPLLSLKQREKIAILALIAVVGGAAAGYNAGLQFHIEYWQQRAIEAESELDRLLREGNGNDE